MTVVVPVVFLGGKECFLWAFLCVCVCENE